MAVEQNAQFIYIDQYGHGVPLVRIMSATSAKQRFAEVLDAAQREPVVIRRHKRDVAVVMSATEYERLRAVFADEFNRFCDRVGKEAKARGLTEEILADILRDDA